MKVVALVVIFLVIWRWTCASPLPCGGESCGQGKETHSAHNCKHIKSYEHYKDIVRSKRDFGLKNISYAVKRAAVTIGKRLHLVVKREIESASENQGPDRSNNSSPIINIPTFNTSSEEQYWRDAQTRHQITDDSSDTGGENKQHRDQEIESAIEDVPKDESRTVNADFLPENNAETSSQFGARTVRINAMPSPIKFPKKLWERNQTRSRRQMPVFNNDADINETMHNPIQNSTEVVLDNNAHTHIKYNFKRQISASKNDSHSGKVQNITIIGKSPTNKRQASTDHQNHTEETQNKTRVERQISSDHHNHTGNAQNTTRVVRQLFPEHYSHTNETQNTTRVVRQTSYSDHHNHTGETQNTTRVVRQTSYSDHHNHTGETQNTTRVVRQTSSDHHNHTGQAQNTTRVVQQTYYSDHHNHTGETQNTTRVVQQTFSDHHNHTGEVQNTTRVVRQTSSDHHNHTGEAQNTTRVVRQTSSDHHNHTGETQNTTRVVRQTSSDHHNHTGEAQNTTRVVRQASFNHQNHTEKSDNTRVVRHSNDSQTSQNITIIKRRIYYDDQGTHETPDSAEIGGQTAVDPLNSTHDAQNLAKVERELFSSNGDTFNLTRIAKQIFFEAQHLAARTKKTRAVGQTSTAKNNTQKAQNTTHVVKPAINLHNNTQNATKVIKQKSSNHTSKPQNATRVVKQVFDSNQDINKIGSQVYYDSQIDKREPEVQDEAFNNQNTTYGTPNTTRVKRQTHYRHSHTDNIQNATRALRQAPSSPNNYTHGTSNYNETNHPKDIQVTSRVLRQAYDSQNSSFNSQEPVYYQPHTEESQNTSINVRETPFERPEQLPNSGGLIYTVKRTPSDNFTYTQEAQNLPRVVKHAPSSHQNHTATLKNATRVARQAFRSVTQHDQKSTRLRRQVVPEHENHTQETQNTTWFAWKIFYQRQNGTQEALNVTNLERQTDNNNYPTENHNNATVNGDVSNVGNNSKEVQKQTKIKREVHDTIIMIRKLTNVTNVDDQELSDDKYDLVTGTDFKSKIIGSKKALNPKCMTQIFISVLKQNRTHNFDTENVLKEEYNTTEPEITNKIKRQIPERSRAGGLASDLPRNIKNPSAKKEKYQQQSIISPKEYKELSQETTGKPENSSIVDNVRIQIQRYYESDFGVRRMKRGIKREDRSFGRKHDLDDSQLSGDSTRTKKNAEHPKNITIQIQKYTHYKFGKRKRNAENTTVSNNKTLINQQPIKIERYVDEPKESLAANIPNLNSTTSTDTSNNTREKRQSLCDCNDIDILHGNEIHERSRRDENVFENSTQSIDNSTTLHNATVPGINLRHGRSSLSKADTLNVDVNDDQIMNFHPRQLRAVTLEKKEVASSDGEINRIGAANISKSNETIPYTVDVSTTSQNASDSEYKAVLENHNGVITFTSYQVIPFNISENSSEENGETVNNATFQNAGYSHSLNISNRDRRSAVLKKKEIDTAPEGFNSSIYANTTEENATVPYTKSNDNSTSPIDTLLTKTRIRNEEAYKHILHIPFPTLVNISSKDIPYTRQLNISEENARIVDNATSQNASLPDIQIRTDDQGDISFTSTVHTPEQNIIVPYTESNGNSTSHDDLLPQTGTKNIVNPVMNVPPRHRRTSATLPHAESVKNSSQNTSQITTRAGGDTHIMKIPRRPRRSALLKRRNVDQNATQLVVNSSMSHNGSFADTRSRRSDNGDVTNIPPRHRQRRSATVTKEDDYTMSEEVPVLSEPSFQFGENGTNQLPPIKFIRTPLLISFSASPDENNTDEKVFHLYELSTENKKALLGTVTEKSSVSNVNVDYNKYEFVPDNSAVDGNFVDKDEDIMSDESESEEEFDEIEIINEKSRKIERVTCACATFPPDSTTEDKNPTLSENFVYVPLGLQKTDKELLCTRNCSGMPKDDLRIKQEVYCVHAKADEKFKKMFPQGQLTYADVSEVIFCQIFPSEAEPTLQFILSWLNVVLLDVVVCLTGLGIVCIYLICFVTFRKRDSGPIYTPAAYNIK